MEKSEGPLIMRKLFTVILFLFTITSFAQIGNWKLTGPVNFPVNVSGQINGIGRISQIKFHPAKDSVIYAVSASGGLFISNNRGFSWTVCGTDQLPRTACSSVCVDYSNDSILYLSTGDANYYGTDYGIWKSLDGGGTWNAFNADIGNRMAVEMLMDPNDHLSVIAATNDGIWKTYDGGVSWTEKYNGGAFTDMCFRAEAGTQVIYASSTNQFFKSADMGENWQIISLPIPGPGNADGIRIGVSPADPDKIYAAVIYVTTSNHYGTIYRSDDGAQTFSAVKTQAFPDIAGYDANDPGQGNYNWTIAVDPLNADISYTGSHCVWKSVNGGINWTQLTNWYAELHTDMHHLVFNPYEFTELWEANDGGVWVSTNDGVNWSTRSDGLAATENYHAAQSRLKKEMVGIGTQDNGELYFSNGGWFTNRGGDWGSRMTFDYLDPTVTYYYENGQRRSLNGSEQSISLPFNATNNSEYAFTPLDPQVCFVGYDNIWRTTNLAATPPTWTQISTFGLQVKALAVAHHRRDQVYMVTSNSKIYRCDNALDANPVYAVFTAPSSTSSKANITTVPNDTNVVYLSCGNKIYRSTNRGQTWMNITGALPSVNVLGLIADPSSGNESIYAGTAKSVWYKNDTMSSWMNYSAGLPTIADIRDLMMYNNGTASNLLRVAYYGRGVWESELFDAASALPDPLFTADTLFGCSGLPVQFTDQSSGNILTWSWSFPGGTPATSTQQHPAVVYNQGGFHDVTLTVTNANGSNTYTRSSYITIWGSTALPLQEGFEGAAFLPPGWLMYSVTNDGAWQHSTIAGGYAASTSSAFFDNYGVDLSGKRYSMRSQSYDLSNSDSALLFFDVAYSQYSNVYSDTLTIYASADCGQTWQSIYSKGGTTLATAPNITSIPFVPASFEWRTDSIWLDQFAGMNQVQFSFENKSGYGQNIYLDNINITDPLSSSLHAVDNNDIQLACYPNPAKDITTVEFNVKAGGIGNMSLLDVNMKVVKNFGTQKLYKGNNKVQLDLHDISSGSYFISVSTVNGNSFSKIEIL
jgi:PKD repeat protein/photosystem II stability/assembly factor-like uncharacterized protein